MAQQCRNLQAFIHVSTAFANAERGTVQEVVYPEPTDPMALVQMFEKTDDGMLDPSRSKLMGRKLNSYAWSKAVAEHCSSPPPRPSRPN